jgi:hypothetical protein
MHAAYSTIGRDINVRFKLSDLSNRAKINLTQDLLQDLGVLRKILTSPLAEDFDRIWSEAVDEKWEQDK